MKQVYLRDAKSGDVCSRRGEVFRVRSVTSCGSGVTLYLSLLSASDEWEEQEFPRQYPEDERVVLLHREPASGAGESKGKSYYYFGYRERVGR